MTGKFAGWLLVSDFDDTLRSEGSAGPISPADREALERFMDGGGRFTIATGRDLCSYLSIREFFPHNAPVIVSNGAVIADRDGTVLRESLLPESSRQMLPAVLAAFPDAGAEIHRGSRAFVVRRTAAVEEHLGRMGKLIREQPVESVPGDWNKIVLVFPGSLSGRSDRAHAAAAWINEGGFHCTAVPSGSLVDVVRAGCDKGEGVALLCRMLGVERPRLAAVGDSWNDLPLLRAAGHAFAPRGAAAEVANAPGVQTLGSCGECLRDVVETLEKLL